MLPEMYVIMRTDMKETRQRVMNKCTKANRSCCRLEISRDSLASRTDRFCNHIGRTKPRPLLRGSWISL